MKVRVRIRSRIPSGERGVTIVLVALVVVVLFGFTALAVDVARLYEERRELQRTADVSALSGGQKLVGLDDEVRSATAKATAIEYINYDENRSVHHDEYFEDCSGAGDCVTVRLSDTTCDPEGLVAYDCITSHVAAPEFDFLLAPVLGFSGPLSIANGNPVRAEATVVLGSGAPGGEKIVPWMLLDCPNGAKYPDEAVQEVIDAALEKNPSCPYEFSDDYSGPYVDLFLDTKNAEGGNFLGADLEMEPDCPAQDGYFGHGGGEFQAILAGDPATCNIAAAARISAQPGLRVGQVNHGLDERGIDSCMNETAFHEAVDVGTVGDGIVSIKDHTSPCLMALMLVVHTDPAHPYLTSPPDYPGDIVTMQHPDPTDVDQGRFSRPNNGASEPMIVRRFAFFYIVERGDVHNPYRGLFLKANDSLESDLSGPYDPDSGITVVKLVQ